MVVEFDITKRLYDDLKGWCQVNNIELNKYVSLKLREALTLDKYGDLNEKVKKVQKKQEKKKKPATPVAEELIPVVPMAPPNPEVTFAPEIEKVTELEPNTDNKEEKEVNTEKKRRTLKTK